MEIPADLTLTDQQKSELINRARAKLAQYSPEQIAVGAFFAGLMAFAFIAEAPKLPPAQPPIPAPSPTISKP